MSWRPPSDISFRRKPYPAPYDPAQTLQLAPTASGQQKRYHATTNHDFVRALEQLIHTLRDAVDFVSRFEKGFAEDVRLISEYASRRVLDELWASKILLSSSERAAAADISGYGRKGEGETERGFEERCAHIKRDYEEVLALAAVPALVVGYGREKKGCDGDRSRKAGVESADRLVEMLERQYRAIRRVAGKIYEDRLYVKEFAKEAELLLGYLEKSRYLWEQGDRRDAGERAKGE